MKPKIFNDLTNIFAKLSGSADYDPRVKYDTALEYYANQVPVLPKPTSGDANKVLTAKSDGTYELKTGGSGTDENAVHYTADTGKTTAEKAQARTNIGATAPALIVTVTETSDVYTANKTVTEIAAAIEAGQTVLCVMYGQWVFHLDGISDSLYTFIYIDHSTEQGGGLADAQLHILTAYTDGTDDTWDYYFRNLEVAPKLVQDSQTSSITLALAKANTIYEYGTLSALTVTAIEANFASDFIIRFTSGSTPTTCTFPSAMKFPTADNQFEGCEANTRYEISVSYGYALVASWPVVSAVVA